MGKSKRRKESYLLAGVLFFILFLIAVGWLMMPALQSTFTKIGQMTALQNHGVIASGCIAEMEPYVGFRKLPELIYRFQIPNGIFVGRISVTDESFEQFKVGDCFDIIYLPEDPTINSAQSFVAVFDSQEELSGLLEQLRFPVIGAGIMILLAIFTYFGRRGGQKHH